MKSTRMGTAVRHAHHLLNAEPSSLKMMLLLSDGYPQDYDYGEDRTDREYGLRDTAMALREAEAGHIIPFNLTVDAAGHDYLRRMCPPHGYLVLGSVEDLPAELPKVYLRLRGS
jgi:nitric oxide reductase NorD protein